MITPRGKGPCIIHRALCTSQYEINDRYKNQHRKIAYTFITWVMLEHFGCSAAAAVAAQRLIQWTCVK